MFSYDVAGQIRSVNVLALAAQNGQISAVDPGIAGVLQASGRPRACTGTTVATTNPNTLSYLWLAPSRRDEYTPTAAWT